jgi:ribosomal-protein-alanine N-acetyltransferase
MDVDITKKVIETDRLILRAWKEGDLNDLFEYARVEGVGERAGWKHHESPDETRGILQMFIDGKTELAVTLKENGKVIGSVGLHESGWVRADENYSDLKIKEIGYVLSKDYWGRGIMPEAVKAVIDYCFNECALDAVSCCHFLENSQSKRVIEKCGFKFVKKDIYFSKQLQKNFDDMAYILTRKDWESQ